MSLFVAVLSIMGFLFVEMMIGVFVFMLAYKRKQLNKIDILVCEMNKQGVQIRREMGRRQNDPHRGPRVVTVGLLPSSIKESLGYEIKDDHMIFSKQGVGRRWLFVALKDGIYSPLSYVLKKKNIDLTEEERALLLGLKERGVIPFEFSEIPETLSLSPIRYEAHRFAADVQMDVRDVYGDKNAEMARTLMRWAFIMIAILVISVIVLLVLFLTLGPDFFTNSAAAVASAPPQPMPGVNLPV
jgi:hypothetical protein